MNVTATLGVNGWGRGNDLTRLLFIIISGTDFAYFAYC